MYDKADVYDRRVNVNVSDDKVIDTPIESNVEFSASDGIPLDDSTLYRKLVGYLVYLIVTSPDIAYAIHVVANPFLLLSLLIGLCCLVSCAMLVVL